jgi:hypothetical protein
MRVLFQCGILRFHIALNPAIIIVEKRHVIGVAQRQPRVPGLADVAVAHLQVAHAMMACDGFRVIVAGIGHDDHTVGRDKRRPEHAEQCLV